MAQITAYLTFNGNCREAMAFYKDCLGGELFLQTVGSSPMADKMPLHMKESILHSTLRHDGLVIMASDMCSDKGVVKGTNVTLCLNGTSEEEARQRYHQLSTGGEATHPLEHTFWGALFGELTDPFGIQWMINVESTLPSPSN